MKTRVFTVRPLDRINRVSHRTSETLVRINQTKNVNFGRGETSQDQQQQEQQHPTYKSY